MFNNIFSITFAQIFHHNKKIDAVRHEIIVQVLKRLRFSFKVYVNGIRG